MTTAYTASNSVPLGAAPTVNGIVQQFVVGTTNSADATFAPDGYTAAPIFGLGGVALQGNELVANSVATLVSYVGPLLNSGALCWILFDSPGGAQQVANATASHHAATLGQVQALVTQANPPGTIIDFSGASAPTGYLACPTTQTNVSRSTYAALFAAIGTTWGAGDGSTTFGMPWFPADYVSSQASGNVGTQTVGQVISHSHASLSNVTSSIGTVGNPSFDVGSGTTGSTGGSANLAASVRLLKCVKT